MRAYIRISTVFTNQIMKETHKVVRHTPGSLLAIILLLPHFLLQFLESRIDEELVSSGHAKIDLAPDLLLFPLPEACNCVSVDV